MSSPKTSAKDIVQMMAGFGMLPAGDRWSPKARARPKPASKTDTDAFINDFMNKLSRDVSLSSRDFCGPDGQFDLRVIHAYVVHDVRPTAAPRVVTDAVITRLEKRLAAVPDHQADELYMGAFYAEGSLRQLDPERVFNYLDHDIAPPPRVEEPDLRTQEDHDREADAEFDRQKAELEKQAAAEVAAEPVRVTLEGDTLGNLTVRKVQSVCLNNGSFSVTANEVAPFRIEFAPNGFDIGTWVLDEGYYLPGIFAREIINRQLVTFPTIEIKDGKRRDLSVTEWRTKQKKLAGQPSDIVVEPAPEIVAKPKVVEGKAKDKRKVKSTGANAPIGNLHDQISDGERAVFQTAVGAWRELEQHEQTRSSTFDQWLLVGYGVEAAQSFAVRLWTARTNRPARGPRYNTLFGNVMDQLDMKVEKNARGRLLLIMPRQAEVTAWRDSLPVSKRDKLHHPVVVWRDFMKSQQPVKPRRPARPSPAALLAIVQQQLAQVRAEDKVRAQALSKMFDFANRENIALPVTDIEVRNQMAAAIQALPVVEIAEPT